MIEEIRTVKAASLEPDDRAVLLGAGAQEMGWLWAAQSLPSLLLALYAGLWVDRLPRRPLLIATDLGQAVVLAAVPVAAVTGHLRLELLYPLAFAASTLAILSELAHASYLPVLIGRGQLVEGNSQLALLGQVTKVVGPALAGALIQAVTAPLALVADAASFVASAGLLGSIRAREPARPPAPRRQALWRELGAGLRVVAAHPILRTLTGAWGLYFFFDSLFQGQIPLYVTRDLQLTPATLGIIISLSSIGGVAGALLAGRVAARFGLGPTLAGSVLVGALGELLVPAARGPALALVVTLVVAHVLVRATDMIFYINYTSVWQALTPDRLRGRVGGTIRVLTAGSVPVGALIGGALGEALGLRATAVVAGLGVVVAFLWLALSPVRTLRELPDQPEEPGDDTAADPPAPQAPSGPLLDTPDARQPVAGGL
jgi:MFS family permease